MICLGFQNAIWQYILITGSLKNIYKIQTNPFIHFFTVNFGFEQKIPFLGTNITYLYIIISFQKAILSRWWFSLFPFGGIGGFVPGTPVETHRFQPRVTGPPPRHQWFQAEHQWSPRPNRPEFTGCRIFVTKKRLGILGLNTRNPVKGDILGIRCIVYLC